MPLNSRASSQVHRGGPETIVPRLVEREGDDDLQRAVSFHHLRPESDRLQETIVGLAWAINLPRYHGISIDPFRVGPKSVEHRSGFLDDASASGDLERRLSLLG